MLRYVYLSQVCCRVSSMIWWSARSRENPKNDLTYLTTWELLATRLPRYLWSPRLQLFSFLLFVVMTQRDHGLQTTRNAKFCTLKVRFGLFRLGRSVAVLLPGSCCEEYCGLGRLLSTKTLASRITGELLEF